MLQRSSLASAALRSDPGTQGRLFGPKSTHDRQSRFSKCKAIADGYSPVEVYRVIINSRFGLVVFYEPGIRLNILHVAPLTVKRPNGRFARSIRGIQIG